MGDCAYKRHQFGLLSTPHVSPVYRVASDQSALILIASDGLWDTIGLQAAVGKVASMSMGETENRAEVVAREMLRLAM